MTALAAAMVDNGYMLPGMVRLELDQPYFGVKAYHPLITLRNLPGIIDYFGHRLQAGDLLIRFGSEWSAKWLTVNGKKSARR